MIEHSTYAHECVRHCEGSTVQSPGLPVAISCYVRKDLFEDDYVQVFGR